MFEFTLPSLTDRLSLSMLGLRAAVADRIAGNAVSVALMTLIYFKLQRIENRVLWLIAAIREGRLRGGWLCPGRASAVWAQGSRRPEVRLPRGVAWLCGLVPYKAAGFGSQLRHLFGDPEFVALLAASPQLRRTLRPLCRMLGIERELVTPVMPVVPVAPVAVVTEGTGDRLAVLPHADAAAGFGGRGDPVVGSGSTLLSPGSEKDGGFCEPL